MIRPHYARVIRGRAWVISNGRMKSLEISWNIKGDSTALLYHWRWFTKVWVAKQIRDLSSPHPELSDFKIYLKSLCYHSASIVRWQRWNGIELAGLDTNSEACGLIGRYPLNLTLSLVLHGCCKRVRWLITCAYGSFAAHHKHSRPIWKGLHTCHKVRFK